MDFDGIDEVVLPTAEPAALVDFYTEVMEFTVASVEDDPDPQLAALWSLPSVPRRTTLLGKPGSAGGWIRAEVPGLGPPAPAGRPDRNGPFALDFYLRDPVATETAIADRYAFRAPAAWYPLPGHPDTMVHEGIVDQTHSGIIHATVGYRPRGTRCVLDSDPAADISEVVAVVFSTHKYDEALEFVTTVLGGQPYLTGEFGGDQIERLLHLDPGELLPMTLFRGPRSRNARLEICRARTPQPPRPDEEVPRVTATIALADLDPVAARLAGGEHGNSTGVLEVVQDGATTRRLGIRTIQGLSLDLVERARS
jgi:catechol 2,3-dioxygenase-like lactoylglutathione lyase family enzyme